MTRVITKKWGGVITNANKMLKEHKSEITAFAIGLAIGIAGMMGVKGMIDGDYNRRFNVTTETKDDIVYTYF